jgi:hypothetical protein
METQAIKKCLDPNQPGEKRYRGVINLLSMLFPDASYGKMINCIIETFPGYDKDIVSKKGIFLKRTHLAKLLISQNPSIQRIGELFVRSLQLHSTQLKNQNNNEDAQRVDDIIENVRNYVSQVSAVESKKRVRKYASRYEKVDENDSEPPEVKKYKRMKVGVNVLLRAYQDELGLNRTKEIIMQLTQYGSLTNPPPMKELRRELSENEYTYEQLSMMMKSMVSDSKESDELIEVYNKHIEIIETVTKTSYK